jgi:hypothetical protein
MAATSDAPRPASDRLSKADKLRLASVVVMAGFALAVTVHYVYGAYCGYRYPYDTYLFRPFDTLEGDTLVTTNHCFGDLLAVCIHAENRDPYFAEIPVPHSTPMDFPSNYFPFGAILPYPLTLIPYPLAVVVFAAGFIAVLAWFNAAFMRTGAPLTDAVPIVALTLMNYPAQVILDRGNIEAFVFAFLAGFAMLLVRRRSTPAAGLLGAAIAMKAAPVIFLPLCHKVAGRRGVVVAAVSAAVLTLASLLLMQSPISVTVPRLLEILGNYSADTGAGIAPANHASGLYGLIAIGAWTSQLTPVVGPAWQAISGAYPVIAAVILVGSMVASVVLPLKLWEIATVGAVCLVLLPSASPDYRLIHMLIPFALFVNSRTPRREGIVTTLLFALLFVPKSWVIIAREVSLNSAINPLILLWLLWRTLHAANGRRLAARSVAAAVPAVSVAATATRPRKRRR